LLSPNSRATFLSERKSAGQKKQYLLRKIKLDSKGRILIPVEVRKNFNLTEKCELELIFSLSKNIIFLVFENGQSDVTSSIKACGKVFTGVESLQNLKQKPVKKLRTAFSPGEKSQDSNPGSGPIKKNEKGGKNDS
jgi:bifunctional DNA-binding transcriptional regulator/antitoxin component of YhaV-PrlF toxin-antitoxin module